MTSVITGTMILWLTWLFFNSCSSLTITEITSSNIPAKTAMNTLLCSSASSVVVLIFKPIIMKKVSPVSNYNPANVANGLLAGLVAITAACNNIHCYSAIIIGIISGFWYITACRILLRFSIDDPLDAS